jgi:hypothetical protein
MANGDPTDVLRSCRRYVSLILGSPPWTVRVGRVRADDDQRPVAVVDASSPLTTLFSRAGTFSQGDVRKGRTLTVVCYPTLGQTAQESAMIAEELAALLNDGFERGLVTADTPPKNIGAPWRLPLYDFAGVPMTGAERAGPTEPYAYANVTDTGFNVRPIQDAMDELRYTVAATVPLTWWRAGRTGRDGPIIRDIPATWGGENVQPNWPGTSVR